MDPGEFAQLMAAVHAVGPRWFLEWGAGGTTREILTRSETIEKYVSVEHDRAWFKSVGEAAGGDPRLSLHLVEADVPVENGAGDAERWAYAMRAEKDPRMFASYIAFPRTLGLTFDFVLVDGRARSLCVVEGFSLLRPGGVLALHDAQRTEYHDAVKKMGNPKFLEPWRSGQLCLLRKPG
jgi:hypothetical protein